MDKKIQEFQLKDGTLINIEAIEVDSKITRVSKKEDIVENFEDSISVIKPVSEVLFDTLKELNTPDEIQLDFGVSLGTNVGVIFVSGDVEANFKVSLKWKNKK